MKKIIIILLLIITVGVTLAVTHVYAQNNADNAAQPKEKEKVKIENPIKEVEVLDYEIDSKPYEYSTMSKKSRIMESLIELTGLISFMLLLMVMVFGIFSKNKPVIKNIHIITAVIFFICASAHLILNFLWKR